MEISKKNNCLQTDGNPMTDMSTRLFLKMLQKSVLITPHLIGVLVILGPSLGSYGNDRVFNTNSINPIFYYILNMEVKSQPLSNLVLGQNPPGQNPPRQNPPWTKSPLGQNPPGQNPPGQNPRTKSPHYILYTISPCHPNSKHLFNESVLRSV